MRKAFFLLLALMMGMAMQAQDIEKTDKFTTGYINGTYVNKYKTIDGVLYAVGYEGTQDWILVRYPAGSRNTTYTVHPNCRRIAVPSRAPPIFVSSTCPRASATSARTPSRDARRCRASTSATATQRP